MLLISYLQLHYLGRSESVLLYVDIETLNTVVNFDTNWIVTTWQLKKLTKCFYHLGCMYFSVYQK